MHMQAYLGRSVQRTCSEPGVRQSLAPMQPRIRKNLGESQPAEALAGESSRLCLTRPTGLRRCRQPPDWWRRSNRTVRAHGFRRGSADPGMRREAG